MVSLQRVPMFPAAFTKMLNFDNLVCFKMKSLIWFCQKTFTMVKENFEFRCPDMIQNEGF